MNNARPSGPNPTADGLLGEIIRRSERRLRIDDLTRHPSSVGLPGEPSPDDAIPRGAGGDRGRPCLRQPLPHRSVDGEPFSDEDEQLIEAFGRAAGLVIDQENAAIEPARIDTLRRARAPGARPARYRHPTSLRCRTRAADLAARDRRRRRARSHQQRARRTRHDDSRDSHDDLRDRPRPPRRTRPSKSECTRCRARSSLASACAST